MICVPGVEARHPGPGPKPRADSSGKAGSSEVTSASAAVSRPNQSGLGAFGLTKGMSRFRIEVLEFEAVELVPQSGSPILLPFPGGIQGLVLGEDFRHERLSLRGVALIRFGHGIFHLRVSLLEVGRQAG